MSKAIIDTTILADALLNSGEAKANAKKALKSFDETLLPVYAIKEFKGGPLKNFVWMHNKLASLNSYEKALDALQRMSRTPRRYTTSTAIQGLKLASGSIAKMTLTSLSEKYGQNASMDKIQCDEFRLALKTIIFLAWMKRRKITTDTVHPLTCYREIAPYERRGLIEIEPIECEKTGNCDMATFLKSRPEELRLMRDAIKESDKPENKKRSKILRQLYRTPKQSIDNNDCRSLGDAIFVFLAPKDAVILTTNVSDHSILASAVGKRAISPMQLFDKK